MHHNPFTIFNFGGNVVHRKYQILETYTAKRSKVKVMRWTYSRTSIHLCDIRAYTQKWKAIAKIQIWYTGSAAHTVCLTCNAISRCKVKVMRPDKAQVPIVNHPSVDILICQYWGNNIGRSDTDNYAHAYATSVRRLLHARHCLPHPLPAVCIALQAAYFVFSTIAACHCQHLQLVQITSLMLEITVNFNDHQQHN